MKRMRMIGFLLASGLLFAVGCKSDDDPVAGAVRTGGTDAGGDSGSDTTTEVDGGADRLPSIAGTYTDGFQIQTISDGSWRIDTSTFHITILDNSKEFLVASNDANNPYDPGKWSRFDWTLTATGELYYCQTAYNAGSEQQAEETLRPNTQDLANGCSGFAWSKLTPVTGDAGS